jgi:hypothetical protein
MRIKHKCLRTQIAAVALATLVLTPVRGLADQQPPPLNCTAPVPVFTQPKANAPQTPSTPRIVIEPTQLDRRIAAAGDIGSLGVTNESSAAIENLSFSFSELLDSKSGHSISPQTIPITFRLDVGVWMSDRKRIAHLPCRLGIEPGCSPAALPSKAQPARERPFPWSFECVVRKWHGVPPYHLSYSRAFCWWDGCCLPCCILGTQPAYPLFSRFFP